MLLWVMDVGFENTCTVSGKWNEGMSSVQDFIFWFCVWCKSRELRGRVSPRFPNHWKLLLRPSASYNELLDKIASRILSNIHDGSLLRNSQRLKTSTISAKKLQHRCSAGFQMLLRLKRYCKCGVQIDCNFMELAAAGWCAGKYLRLDWTIKEPGMFEH